MGWDAYIIAWKLRLSLLKTKFAYVWSKRDASDDEFKEVLNQTVEDLFTTLRYLVKPALMVSGLVLVLLVLFSS